VDSDLYAVKGLNERSPGKRGFGGFSPNGPFKKGRYDKRQMVKTVLQEQEPKQPFTSLDSTLKTKKNAFNQKDYQTRTATTTAMTLDTKTIEPRTHVNFCVKTAPQSVHSRRCKADGDIDN